MTTAPLKISLTGDFVPPDWLPLRFARASRQGLRPHTPGAGTRQELASGSPTIPPLLGPPGGLRGSLRRQRPAAVREPLPPLSSLRLRLRCVGLRRLPASLFPRSLHSLPARRAVHVRAMPRSRAARSLARPPSERSERGGPSRSAKRGGRVRRLLDQANATAVRAPRGCLP